MDLNKAKNKEEYVTILQKNKEAYHFCPKCGCSKFTTTVTYGNKNNGYVDLNVCFCFNCKKHHSIDQRVTNYIK